MGEEDFIRLARDLYSDVRVMLPGTGPFIVANMDDGWISKKKSTEWPSMVSKDDFKLTPESFATAFDLRVCPHGNKPFVSKPERTPNQTDQNGTSPNGPMTGAKATGVRPKTAIASSKLLLAMRVVCWSG
jgi:hypothetical protein